jgi:putative toxin-antitoxin system antitoxin component (TIGR02293 family)
MATLPENVFEVLGGRSVFGARKPTEAALIQAIRGGLPRAALEAVAGQLNSPSNLNALLSASKRTFARRKKQARLTVGESDRLVRLARLLARAVTVFGTREKAVAWLEQPNRALRNLAPLSLMDTDVGALEVGAVLTRIEHGVFA